MAQGEGFPEKLSDIPIGIPMASGPGRRVSRKVTRWVFLWLVAKVFPWLVAQGDGLPGQLPAIPMGMSMAR